VLGTIGQQIRNDLKTETPKVAILAEKACGPKASSPRRRRTCRR